jgi:hypothetical protein
MQDWQFLLQKEDDSTSGDSSAVSLWRAPHNATIAIEEGKYRVIARSIHTNLDVEITITHQITETGKSLRRSQKRCRRTNSAGLLTVLPFTELQSGWWEIECRGELLSEQQNLEIQVYSKNNSQVDNQPAEESLDVSADLNFSSLVDRESNITDTVNLSTNLSTSDFQQEGLEELPQIQPIATEIASPDSDRSSSGEIDLFEPKKVAQESVQTQPLSGLILPPKMPSNNHNDDTNQLSFLEQPRSNKHIQLPKVNSKKIEPIDPASPQLLHQHSEGQSSSDRRESDELVETPNLQTRFWSLIESLVTNDNKSL